MRPPVTQVARQIRLITNNSDAHNQTNNDVQRSGITSYQCH